MHTELACEIFCGLTAEAAAAVTDLAMENLSATATEPVYEIWRQRIQVRFAKEAAIV
jgi:enediyne biosynthesis protein E3